MKQILYNFMLLLNGPVQNALFRLLNWYRNVCVWFMARNCPFLKVGTLCWQRGNDRLPLQGIGGSHQSEVRFPSWELEVTIASNCWFPDVGTDASQCGNKGYWNQRLPLEGAACPERLELLVPNLGTKWVTLASKCRLPEDGTHASRPGNHRLPLQGILFFQEIRISVFEATGQSF